MLYFKKIFMGAFLLAAAGQTSQACEEEHHFGRHHHSKRSYAADQYGVFTDLGRELDRLDRGCHSRDHRTSTRRDRENTVVHRIDSSKHRHGQAWSCDSESIIVPQLAAACQEKPDPLDPLVIAHSIGALQKKSKGCNSDDHKGCDSDDHGKAKPKHHKPCAAAKDCKPKGWGDTLFSWGVFAVKTVPFAAGVAYFIKWGLEGASHQVDNVSGQLGCVSHHLDSVSRHLGHMIDAPIRGNPFV